MSKINRALRKCHNHTAVPESATLIEATGVLLLLLLLSTDEQLWVHGLVMGGRFVQERTVWSQSNGLITG